MADLERLCAESEFERPQFRFTNDGGVPGAPRVSWQRLSFGLLNGRRFSDNVLMMSRRRL
jgi:hypothetical protein